MVVENSWRLVAPVGVSYVLQRLLKSFFLVVCVPLIVPHQLIKFSFKHLALFGLKLSQFQSCLLLVKLSVHGRVLYLYRFDDLALEDVDLTRIFKTWLSLPEAKLLFKLLEQRLGVVGRELLPIWTLSHVWSASTHGRSPLKFLLVSN